MKKHVMVITGSSRGLGEGLARLAAQDGYSVALCARSIDTLEALSEELNAQGYDTHPFYMDLRDIASIRAAFTTIEETLGPIEVLINNAGMGNPIPATDVTEEDWDELIDLNLKGTFFAAQEAGKRMIKRGYGRIVNISSQAAQVVIQDESVYCTSKAGVTMMTKALAYEWASFGVTVNAIAPTFIRTPGTAKRLDDPVFGKSIINRIPAGRTATIEECYQAIRYFIGENTAIVTGTQLLLDGGWTLA
ncbi:MAG: SDR family oxidoreductase [Sphaerochaeta sp.]